MLLAGYFKTPLLDLPLDNVQMKSKPDSSDPSYDLISKACPRELTNVIRSNVTGVQSNFLTYYLNSRFLEEEGRINSQ